MKNRSFLERCYRSPLGRAMSAVANAVARVQRPFMVYGFRDRSTGEFRKYTRISSTATILNRDRLAVADYVWVWHHTILDATEGIEIGEGCQIGAWVGVFTHGSEKAIRLLGRSFIDVHNTERVGYTRGPVRIGPYTFIAAGSVILPGVTIGEGCLIGAGSLVTRDVPAGTIAAGMPAKNRGQTLDLDMAYLNQRKCRETYYDQAVVAGLSEEGQTDSQ